MHASAAARSRLGLRIASAIALAIAWPSAWAFCFEEAGKLYGLNPALLRGMAKVESNLRPEAVNNSHRSRTKTVDLGLMQINSGWLPSLARYGITRELLLEDACLNVKVGAWVLARTFQQVSASWDGVGAYNAVCTQLKGEACTRARMTYAHKVWAAMNNVDAERSRPTGRIDTAARAGFSPRVPAERISTVVIGSAD